MIMILDDFKELSAMRYIDLFILLLELPSFLNIFLSLYVYGPF